MVKNKSIYITSIEAAQLLGFTPDYIRRLIVRGKIKATKLGHNYLIRPIDLKKIKRTRFKRKKEKK